MGKERERGWAGSVLWQGGGRKKTHENRVVGGEAGFGRTHKV